MARCRLAGARPPQMLPVPRLGARSPQRSAQGPGVPGAWHPRLSGRKRLRDEGWGAGAESRGEWQEEPEIVTENIKKYN